VGLMLAASLLASYHHYLCLRNDGCCPHKVLQHCRQGLALGMYVNGNTAKVSGLDRIFVTEDNVSREKGDVAEHAHVLECFGIHNPVVRAAFRTGCRHVCMWYAGIW